MQNHNFTFLKIALNHVLSPDSSSTRNLVQDALKISSVGALGVELWPFYCEIRILVPMSYIAFEPKGQLFILDGRR